MGRDTTDFAPGTICRLIYDVELGRVDFESRNVTFSEDLPRLTANSLVLVLTQFQDCYVVLAEIGSVGWLYDFEVASV